MPSRFCRLQSNSRPSHPGYAALLWPTGGTDPVWLGSTNADDLETATPLITTMQDGMEGTHMLTIIHTAQEVGTKQLVNSSILGMLDR
ncbi:hypothetical protein B0H17DRAFT_1204708 [Mycena rosella]|uniref:Uncharacterized protein n=1 Tax=Mycena rosella TaxID=1033263 RepID=A0AAD7D8W8_MYCRO|nr:hypothetical protein B0H17DRAFT_1204708 [Mycena rosella]